MPALLSKDVDDYVAYASIEKITSGQYLRSVKCFSTFLARPATRDDLREPPVNKWLAYVATQLSPFTVLGRKRGITPVWNWLAGQGLVPWYNSRALRKTKVTYGPVMAWSTTQVRALLAGAGDLRGELQCGIRASQLMDAYVRLAYESGLRPSDLYRLRWEQLCENRLSLVQHKTRYGHAVILSPGTLKAIQSLRSAGCETIFALEKGGIRRWELMLFEAAERHGFTRQHRQACGTLRKTHGTEVCRVDGLPAAAQSLGHVDGIRVARQSYCEASAIAASKPPAALINALTEPKRNDISAS